jgi:AcrR family transcriptional regulator
MSAIELITHKAVRKPVLQDRVTAAIATAFFEELAEVGYGQMSVDAIIRRAGVGKAALYRRWPNKNAMAVALISKVTAQEHPAPNTGTLRGDLLALAIQMSAAVRHPLASRVIPALAAEAGHNQELESVLRDTVETPRRANVAEVLGRATARGELPQDCDVDLALELIAGPLYWRILVRRRDYSAQMQERLADGLVAALSAIHKPK